MLEAMDRLRWRLDDLREDAQALRAQLQETGGLDTAPLMDLLEIPSGPAPQRWVLVGEVSSGKSTLLNVLLGRDCLPEGTGSTTTLTTRVLPPSADRPDGTLVLEPYSQGDYASMLDWLLDQLPVVAEAKAPPRERAQAVLRSAAADREHQARLNALKLVIARMDECSEHSASTRVLRLGEPAASVTDHDALRWRRATLYLNTRWSDLGVEWTDTPGFGHQDPLHRWVVERELGQAERILFLLEPRGATREAFDVICALDAATLERMVLVFSRIDELGDEAGDWEREARRVIEQLGWTGAWYGVSALCDRYAREARRLHPDPRQRRRLEKVALQMDPLDADANLRLAGVERFAEHCVRGPIIAAFQDEIERHISVLQSVLTGQERELRKRRLIQRRGRLERGIEARILALPVLDNALMEGAASRLDAFVAAHGKVYQKIDAGIVTRTEELQQRLFEALDDSDRRTDALRNLLRTVSNSFVSNRRTLWEGLKHWLRRPFIRSDRRCPWVPPNIVKLQDSIARFEECWGGHFDRFSQHRAALLTPEARAGLRLGLREDLRDALAVYVDAQIQATMAETRASWMTLYRQSGVREPRTPLRRTLARWQESSLDAFRQQQRALLRQCDERLRAHSAAMQEVRRFVDDVLVSETEPDGRRAQNTGGSNLVESADAGVLASTCQVRASGC